MQWQFPMEAGILLTLSCLLYGGGHVAAFKHDLNVDARLIIISDGWPSTSANIGAQEIDKMSKESLYDGTIARLNSLIKTIGKTSPIVCIPVGSDPNIRMTTHILDAKEVGQVTRQDIGRIARFSSIETDFTESDLEDVFTIVNGLNAYKPPTVEDLKDDDDVFTERHANLPTIGTRVKRGPHWTYKNQDSNGPGTVIGHSEKFGWVFVEWDNGVRLRYQYGFDGLDEKYDIATTSEPRVLINELIAVGCLVIRA
ncbi:uncharacterized protein LOC133178088 [Saccostrea echinata]|uniref:uncharacterized protein LOC133178088 n=1 Tax=Saccostrea echinata TaxID=191078 RepID=UPI002A8086A6|nr:uncharacterized protein LOC133178088 [Saccostrea echinata]